MTTKEDFEMLRGVIEHWVYDVQNKNDPEVQYNLAVLDRIEAEVERLGRLVEVVKAALECVVWDPQSHAQPGLHGASVVDSGALAPLPRPPASSP
jgi:hypothetical protein